MHTLISVIRVYGIRTKRRLMVTIRTMLAWMRTIWPHRAVNHIVYRPSELIFNFALFVLLVLLSFFFIVQMLFVLKLRFVADVDHATTKTTITSINIARIKNARNGLNHNLTCRQPHPTNSGHTMKNT